jgi:hypothetical protein
MARRTPPRKVTYFEPVPPRLAGNIIIESTFEVGHRFRCTMRRRLRSARSRRGDSSGSRGMASADARAPRRTSPRLSSAARRSKCSRTRRSPCSEGEKVGIWGISGFPHDWRAILRRRTLPCRPAGPVPAPLPGKSGLQVCKDSPLEGGGFEPSVPRRGPSPSWPLNLLRP